MSVRTFDYYAHCGRTFVCDNSLLISSIQEALDTVNWAHQRGHTFSAYSQQLNALATLLGSSFPAQRTLPIVGHENGKNYPYNWYNTIGIEIPGDYTKFALTTTIRKLRPAEFDRVNAPYLSGLAGYDTAVPNPLYAKGLRAFWCEVIITNLNTASSQTLIRIFNDKQYMYNTYGFTAQTYDYNWGELSPTEFVFTLDLLGDITLDQTTGTIEHYLLTMRVVYQENQSGLSWTSSQITNGYTVEIYEQTHPQTGDSIYADGFLDMQFTAYK